MRADRLISILLHLQVHQRLTASDLASRLEVSERTIHRDMEALSGAGFPVYAERGVNGGWSLMEGYKTNFTDLNEAEIQTIFLSKPNRLLTDLGLDNAAQTALDKLLASLPAIYRQDAEYYRQRIHVDTTDRYSSDEDVLYLSILQEAVWEERQIRLVYKLSNGPVIEPTLHPLGLVAKNSTWYLVAVYGNEIGVYRVSNIRDTEMLAGRAIRPADFDLATFWAKSSAEFAARIPPYRVDVRLSPDVVHAFDPTSCHACLVERGIPDKSGWTDCTLCFETEKDAFRELVKYGAQIEIEQPVELRQSLINHARELLAFYGQATNQTKSNLPRHRYGKARRLAA